MDACLHAFSLSEAFFLSVKVSSNATSYRKSSLILSVKLHLPFASLSSVYNSATAPIAFYLVLP